MTSITLFTKTDYNNFSTPASGAAGSVNPEEQAIVPIQSHYPPFIQTCIQKGFLHPDTLEITSLGKALPVENLKKEHLLDFLEFICQEVPLTISKATKDHFKKLWNSPSFIESKTKKEADLYGKVLNSALFKTNGDSKPTEPILLCDLLSQFNLKCFKADKRNWAFVVSYLPSQVSGFLKNSLESWNLDSSNSTTGIPLMFMPSDGKKTIRCKLDAKDDIIDLTKCFIYLIVSKFNEDPSLNLLYQDLLEYEFQLHSQQKNSFPCIQLGPKLELIMENINNRHEMCSLDALYLYGDKLSCSIDYYSYHPKITEEEFEQILKTSSFNLEIQDGSVQQTFLDWAGKICRLHRPLNPQEFVTVMQGVSHGYIMPPNAINFLPKNITETQIVDAISNIHEKEKNGANTLVLLINVLMILHTKMGLKNDQIKGVWKNLIEKHPEIVKSPKNGFIEVFYEAMQSEQTLDKIIQEIQLPAFMAYHTMNSHVEETQWMDSVWKIDNKIVIPRLPISIPKDSSVPALASNIFHSLITNDCDFKFSQLWNSDCFPVAQMEKTALIYLESQSSPTVEMGYRLLMHCQASHPHPAILENLYKYISKLFLEPVEHIKIKSILEALIKLSPQDKALQEFSSQLAKGSLTSEKIEIQWIKALTSSAEYSHQKLGIQLLNAFLKKAKHAAEIQSESASILKNLQNVNHPELPKLFYNFIQKNILHKKQALEIFHSFFKDFSNKQLGHLLLLIDCIKVILDNNKNDKNFVFSNDEDILRLLSWFSDQPNHSIEIDLLEKASNVLSKTENLQSLWIKVINQKIDKKDIGAVLKIWSSGKSKNIWQIRDQTQQIPNELLEFYKTQLMQEPPLSELCQEIVKELSCDSSKEKSTSSNKTEIDLFLTQVAKKDRDTALKLSKKIQSYLKTSDTFAFTIFEASKDREITDQELIELARAVKSENKHPNNTLPWLIKTLLARKQLEKGIEILFWAIEGQHLSVNNITRELWINALTCCLENDKLETPCKQCVFLLERGFKLSLGDILPKDSKMQTYFLEIFFIAFSENHSNQVRQLLLNKLKWAPSTATPNSKIKNEKPFALAMKEAISRNPKKAITVLDNIQTLNPLPLADEKTYVTHLLSVLPNHLLEADYQRVHQILLSLLKKPGHGIIFENLYPLIKKLFSQKFHRGAFDLLLTCIRSQMTIESKILHQLFLNFLDFEVQKKSNDITFALKIWREGQKLEIWNQDTFENGSECLEAFLNLLVAGKISSESEQVIFEIVDIISNADKKYKDKFEQQLRSIFSQGLSKNKFVFSHKLFKQIFSFIKENQIYALTLMEKLLENKLYNELSELIKLIFNTGTISYFKKTSPSLNRTIQELEQTEKAIETLIEKFLEDKLYKDLSELIKLIFSAENISYFKKEKKDRTILELDLTKKAIETLIDSQTYEEIRELNLENSKLLIHVKSLKVLYCLLVQALDKLAMQIPFGKTPTLLELTAKALEKLNNALKAQKKEGLVFPKTYLLKHAKILKHLRSIQSLEKSPHFELYVEKQTSFELLLPILVNHGTTPQTDPKLKSVQRQDIYDFLTDFVQILLNNRELSHRCLSDFLIGAAIAAEADNCVEPIMRLFKEVFDLFKDQTIRKTHVNLYIKFVSIFINRLIDNPIPKIDSSKIQYWIDIILNEPGSINLVNSEDVLKWIGFYHSQKNPSMTSYYLLEMLPKELKSDELYQQTFSLIMGDQGLEINKQEPLVVIVDMLRTHKEQIKKISSWKVFVLNTIKKLTESKLKQDIFSLYRLSLDFDFLHQSDFFPNKIEYVRLIKALISLPQITQKLLSSLKKILDQLDLDKSSNREEKNFIIHHLLRFIVSEDISLTEKITHLQDSYLSLTNRKPNSEGNFFEFIKDQALSKNPSSEFFDFAQIYAASTAIAYAIDDNPEISQEVSTRSFTEVCQFIESSLSRMLQLKENLLVPEYSSALFMILQTTPYLTSELDKNSIKLQSIKDCTEKICSKYWDLFSKKPEVLIPIIKSFMALSSCLYEDGLKLFYKMIGENLPTSSFSNQTAIEKHYVILIKAAQKKDSLIERNSEVNEIFVRIVFHGLVLMYNETRDFKDFLERAQAVLQIVAHTKLDKNEPVTVDTMKIWSPGSLSETHETRVIKRYLDRNSSPISQVTAYLKQTIEATNQENAVFLERPNLMRLFGSPHKVSNKTMSESEFLYHQRFASSISTMLQKLLEMTYTNIEDFHTVSYFCELALEFLIMRYPNDSYSQVYKSYAFHQQGFTSMYSLQKHVDCLKGAYHHLTKYKINSSYLPLIFQYQLIICPNDIETLNLAFQVNSNLVAFNEFKDLLLNMEIGCWVSSEIIMHAISKLNNPNSDVIGLTLQAILDKVERHLFVNNRTPILSYRNKPILFVMVHHFIGEGSRIFSYEFYDKLMHMLNSEVGHCPDEFKEELFEITYKLAEFMEKNNLIYKEELPSHAAVAK